ncbi:DNA-formamidopyrimidine glycosylase family protein, partial [Pseudomonas syringae group genomosp. 7]|uniref:DNA-formamidopyrimidine glycosylase family protein n=1 Tax=Pseudomonas syringae group genomosp. 7 TaxID=251699 RepID=UPI00376FAECD
DETTRRGIEPNLERQRVSRLIVPDTRLRWPLPEEQDNPLSGQRIVQVDRRANYLMIHAEAGTKISHQGKSVNLLLVE